MAQRIDAEHDQEGGQGAVVSLRPGTAAPAPRNRPAAPTAPSPAAQEAPAGGKPIWDKNNFGFWLAVCIVVSLVFSIVYRALA